MDTLTLSETMMLLEIAIPAKYGKEPKESKSKSNPGKGDEKMTRLFQLVPGVVLKRAQDG